MDKEQCTENVKKIDNMGFKKIQVVPGTIFNDFFLMLHEFFHVLYYSVHTINSSPKVFIVITIVTVSITADILHILIPNLIIFQTEWHNKVIPICLHMWLDIWSYSKQHFVRAGTRTLGNSRIQLPYKNKKLLI